MGLFDMFGAGGGTASIRVDSPMVAQGGVVSGQIIFTGGSRAQQVTKVTLRVSQSHKTMKMTPNGPQQHTESRDVVPNFQVAGSYTTTPGQPQAFPFQINIPAGAPPSVPGQVTYSLHAGIDIPGEVDAGAHQEISVTGGAMGVAQPMMGQPMGMMGQPMGMQQPMMGQPMGMQQPMMSQPMMQQPMMQQPLGIGSAVMAMWQDGQLHPGRIVGQQNGMFGIDWDEPHLGASTWVHPGQVQPSMGMPMGKPGMDPMMQKQMMDPMHKGGAPMGKPGMDPMMQKGHDPMMQKGHDPMMQKGHDPMHKGGMPMQGGGVMMGSHVLAQHPSGQWAHGRVAAMQNGMIGVDWDDPKLGASSWVAPHQVQSK